MSVTTEQRQNGLKIANRRRREVAELQADIRSGRIELRDVLLDPPDTLLDVAIIDAVRMTRRVSRRRTPAWVERMGRAAVRDNVNLMLPLGRASSTTRAWVADYADYRRWRREPEEDAA